MICGFNRRGDMSKLGAELGLLTFDKLLPNGGPRSDDPEAPDTEAEAAEVAAAAAKEVLHDRERRRYSIGPLQKNWLQRAAMAFLLTAMLRVLAGRVNTGHHGGHGHEEGDHAHHRRLSSHDAGALPPSAPEHHTDAHHADAHGLEADPQVTHILHELGIDMHGNIWGLQWTLLILLFLIGATVFFEGFREKLEEEFKNYKVVLEHVWSEFTVLGFLALVTFLMIQGGLLQAVSHFAFGDPEHLVHIFEALHFALFFVMLGFLFLSLWLLYSVAQNERVNDAFDVTLNYYRNVAGTSGHSVLASLGMQGNSKHLGHDFGAALVDSELGAAEAMAAEQQASWLGWVVATFLTAFDPSGWELQYAQRLARYQRLRHRFILAPADFGKETLPPNFEFSDYLLKCVQTQLCEILELGVPVWLRAMGLVVVLCEVTALATEASPHLAQYLLIAAGWALLFQACLVQQHYVWVLEQLTPVTSVVNSLLELERLRDKGAWRIIYDRLHVTAEEIFYGPEYNRRAAEKSEREQGNSAWWMKVTGVEAGVAGVEKVGGLLGAQAGALAAGTGDLVAKLPGSEHIKAAGAGIKAAGEGVGQLAGKGLETVGQAGQGLASAGQGLVTAAGEVGKVGLEEVLGEQDNFTTTGLEPGEYMRRGIAKDGECKQTQLFWIKKKVKEGEEVDLFELKNSANRPAQVWVQSMLLLTSLQITISCVFGQPTGVHDWKIIAGILPVIVMMIFVVPDTLEPMITALSIEMLVDTVAVQEVLQEAKVRRFAHAAKLLQTFRTLAVAHMRAKDAQGSKPSKLQAFAGKIEERAMSYARRPKPKNGVKAPPADLEALMATLPLAEKKRVVQLKETFELFDVDGDGELEPKELRSMMRSNGIEMSLVEVQNMINAVDQDGDGTISFVEFVAYMLNRDELPPHKVAEAIFEMFDTDGSGVLSTSELRSAFQSLNTGLDEDELMEIVHMFDLGHTGRVEKTEFTLLLTQVLGEEQ